MKFQVVGNDGHWHSVSADRVEEMTLFDTEEEAWAVIPELARCLDCDETEIAVIERPDLE